MRSKDSILNFLTGIFGQIIMLVLGFVSRSLFLMILSVEYLGASGLFSSILTMLSFAELGVGTAIIYSLYKPLSEKNEEEIMALMNLFKKVYRIIGIVVFVFGMAFLPFLDLFVTDRKGIENLELIYVLFVVQTAISYFFSYNRSLITADQKAYKLVKLDYANKILHVLAPIAILALTRSYIAYLLTQIAVTFLWNLCTYFKVQNMYPILKMHRKVTLSQETKKAIIKNTLALLIYKIAIVVTSGTDNILISRFFGLTAVGLCSNYTLITQNMTALVSQGINAVTASVGNLSSTESDEKKYSIFKVLFFVNFWIYAYVSIGLYLCASPLVSVVFGSQYVISNLTLAAMVLGFFVLGMQGATSVFRDAQGLFWYGKLRPLAQTIINLGASILLAIIMKDISSIFWGTVISRLATSFWYDPLVVYRHGFKRPVSSYFIRYTLYAIIAVVALFTCYFIVTLINIANPILNLVIRVIICTIIVNGIFLVVFSRTTEFKYICNMLKNFIKLRKKNNND